MLHFLFKLLKYVLVLMKQFKPKIHPALTCTRFFAARAL